MLVLAEERGVEGHHDLLVLLLLVLVPVLAVMPLSFLNRLPTHCQSLARSLFLTHTRAGHLTLLWGPISALILLLRSLSRGETARSFKTSVIVRTC